MKESRKLVHKKIGLKIAYYRKLKGWSQEELSEAAGKSLTFIGSIEAPKMEKVASLDTLLDIAEALEIPAYKLLMIDD